jgi:hypothetical protein
VLPDSSKSSRPHFQKKPRPQKSLDCLVNVDLGVFIELSAYTVGLKNHILIIFDEDNMYFFIPKVSFCTDKFLCQGRKDLNK